MAMMEFLYEYLYPTLIIVVLLALIIYVILNRKKLDEGIQRTREEVQILPSDNIRLFLDIMFIILGIVLWGVFRLSSPEIFTANYVNMFVSIGMIFSLPLIVEGISGIFFKRCYNWFLLRRAGIFVGRKAFISEGGRALFFGVLYLIAGVIILAIGIVNFFL